MKKRNHLTKKERVLIEKFLNEGRSFRFIARALNRNCSTVSREVRRHYIFKKTGCHGSPFNDCLYRKNCTNHSLCPEKKCLPLICKRCPHCPEHCIDYQKEVCPLLEKSPYVCNGCKSRNRCTLEKKFYAASYAQKEYSELLSESRSGIRISQEELLRLDNFFSPLIKNGQSVEHILAHNPGRFSVSKRTLYNYIDAGLLSAKNIDLPRKVRFRITKSKFHSACPKSCRVGRNYRDFILFMKEHPGSPVVQLDSVEGSKGGKVLLTIHFVQSEFMLAFLRQKNTADSVHEIFEELYQRLNPITFQHLFPVVLTDNGTEFSDPDSLERDIHNNLRTRVFYCNPLAPYQKGAAENNHTFIRRIIPKGTSLNNLTQQDINLMMNHINSYSRSTLNHQPPYLVFSRLYGKDILTTLNFVPIPPNEIILRPRLLQKR